MYDLSLLTAFTTCDPTSKSQTLDLVCMAQLNQLAKVPFIQKNCLQKSFLASSFNRVKDHAVKGKGESAILGGRSQPNMGVGQRGLLGTSSLGKTPVRLMGKPLTMN